MNTETKEQIKIELAAYVEKVGSQMEASRRMQDVSNATISNILKDKWDNISNDMWTLIINQIKATKKDKWLIDTNTERVKRMLKYYADAKEHALVFCLVGAPGTGKTAVAELYKGQQNVFLVKCNEYVNRKAFLVAVLAAMGKYDCFGYTVDELMEKVLGVIHRSVKPIIILDEADKLTDQVLYFFITIYNETEDKCGLIMQATDHLAKRIQRGCKQNKKGYSEIFSRIGRKFLYVPENTNDELMAIVKLNGIDDEALANKIVNDSEDDIRRIKRLVFANKRKLEEAE